ncbi:uncharacterized protein TNCV_1096051 [Trichonephila clavipes]|nr:uncharacterized protein TNCV_1096051 [Trichonephila clavipes]
MSLNKLGKDELKIVAEELNLTVPEGAKIAGLKNLIVNSDVYKNDKELVQSAIDYALAEIKNKRLDSETKLEFERIKLAQLQKQLELANIQKNLIENSDIRNPSVFETAANINVETLLKRILVAFPEIIEIHGFADASERCYGAAVYCKSKNLKSETLVRLITSKSRVAPIKSLTIPRLELCAAVLLAKLVKRVVAALQLETAELYLWSDSMIVLAWLRKEPMDLKTFVQNRVAKIQELYPNQLWRHVPSDQNPADLVSLGIDPDKLLQQNLWFNGPTFLSGDDYPNRTINCREKLDEYNSELKNCVNEQIENFQSVLNIHVNDFLNDLLNLSAIII